ncbi:hypothetical protein CCR94_01145 [Rhodoblastus sphagnicola]|uniref:Biotin carboxyl carrier protein of acetyl-CoA carboxylase n=1 Tax=Rhodoblastus sphagnicola TaxID=333368 RepID=A0A2S6NGA0_9HYPH|nr:biotin/lipoyl-containing protein [Rhodoblastus sphagnicola]MBB4200825.1 acetyl-CoA carboxylase biotin carboxyl carrier protein [Rhodoblastus sphagnicola]PPQ33614.1 hypothetical protein CCR94_01145 [Rhodoblastus sphagnicola]
MWTQELQVLSAPTLMQPAGTPPAAAAGPAQAPAEALAVDGLVDIRAPLVGHFYRASKPGAPPFVEVGSRVEPESVVAIIETMKLMNSVHAGVKGRVVEIFRANGQLVEQDTALMRVETEEA